MNRIPMFVCLLLVLIPASALAANDTTVVITSRPTINPAAQEGSALRAATNKAVELSRVRDYTGAWQALTPVLAICDSKRSTPTTIYASLLDDQEVEEFTKSLPNSATLVRVDVACPSAYKTAAFLAVEVQDYPRALAYLAQAQLLAPYWAEPYIERGFILGHTHELENALASYRKALEFSGKYKSSATAEAAAYRGIGWVLVEMGDLDDARKAYKKSQRTEPDSEVAKSELQFIQQQLDAKR